MTIPSVTIGNRRRFHALILTLNIGAMLVATPLAAQTAPPAEDDKAGLEEIVVTAQRREESAQDVPIALTAFSGAELERRNITDALALTQYVPNLIATNNTGLSTANTYYIRGIGDGESLASKDPPVGTYIDDIYFSRQSTNNFAYFDIERIEVLRGPQGTLFGRNTTGGAVNVHLKKPSEEFKGYVEAAYGRFDQVSLRAGLDLPVSPTFLTKVSAYYNDDNGYVRNTVTGERLNDEQGYGGRLGIRALPSDSITWDAFATYMYAAGSNMVNFTCDPVNPTNCNGRFATTGLLKANRGASQYPTLTIANGKANLPLGNETDTHILGSNIAIETGGPTINLITGYVDTRQKYNLDFFDGRAAPGYSFVVDPATGRPSAFNLANNVSAGGPVRGRPGGFALAARTKSRQFTQEIKFTGNALDGLIDYVAGVFYLKERNYSDFADILTGTGPAAAPPAAPFTQTLLADRILRNNTEAWAAYTQLDFNVTDQLKLTAGVRYTDEDKVYNFSDNRPACQVTPVPATCIDNANFVSVDNDLNPATPNITIPRAQNIKIWTPRFALNYKPNEDILLFASATRGFKSGGQSARSTAVRLLLPFDAETVWSYELGLRSEWFNRKLRFNLTGFYADTQDLQGGSAFVTTNLATGAQSLSFVTRNFADFRNKGLEFDITALPIPGLNITISGGYQDAEYIIDPNRADFYGTVPTAAQQRECLAARAGLASPRGDTRSAILRAGSSCGNGVVTPTGEIAKPIRTPKWTISGGVFYDIPVVPLGGAITPSVNFSYVSAHEVGSANVSIWRNSVGVLNADRDGEFVTGSFSAAHVLINAGLAFRTDDNLWTASLECSNCFDKAFPQASLSNFTYLNQPMSWLMRVKRAF
jgi:iron complex outermembrane recepter protein